MPPTVPPVGPTNRFERTTPSTPSPPPASPEAFGQVFDLAVARARRTEAAPSPIPSAVRAEMDAADRLFAALAAQGHELRFTEPSVPGERVRVELCTLDGTVVRQVPLAEAVDLGAGPEPAA